MINEDGEKLIEHHVKYREIHGTDETTWMTRGDHNRLHRRLRNEGKCNIPVDELRKISIAARNRTDKSKSYFKQYYSKNKAVRISDELMDALKEYNIKKYGSNIPGKITETAEMAILTYIGEIV